jgi:hypothetical protein
MIEPKKNDVASELSKAAIDSVTAPLMNSPTYFDDTFTRLNPSAQEIARAMCIAAASHSGFTIVQQLLNAYLQSVLTRDHVRAQERMASTATILTWAIIFLTVVSIFAPYIVPLITQRHPTDIGVSGRILVLDIANPIVHWGYFGLAVLGSLFYGFGCYTALVAPRPEKLVALVHQFWFNAAGAAIGWIAGWVVLVNWLSCPGYLCRGEPKGWTIAAAILAFVGVTGHLPLTINRTIAAIHYLVRKMFPDP